MTIPAGWYDDGSGRQRWWDGSGWTEHTVSTEPGSPAPAAVRAAEDARDPSAQAQSPSMQVENPSTQVENPSTQAENPPTQVGEPFAPPYVLSSSDAAGPGAHPPHAGGQYGDMRYGNAPHPGAQYPRAQYPGAQYPAAEYEAAQYGAPGTPHPVDGGMQRRTRASVLGIVGLSVVALGVILSCVPPVSVIGWVLLGVGFVVSLISLFLRGAKWPGIAGIALSVLGAVLAVAVALLTLAAARVPTALDDDPTPLATPGTRPTDAPSSEPSPATPATPVEGTDTVTFEELEVGQCLPYIEWEDEVSELPIVPCDQPHTDEVYLIFDAPDGEFPGDDALQSIASERCESAFGEFVGLAYAESELDMYWFVPTQMSWNRANDRAIQCIAFSYEDVTGTLRGAAR